MEPHRVPKKKGSECEHTKLGVGRFVWYRDSMFYACVFNQISSIHIHHCQGLNQKSHNYIPFERDNLHSSCSTFSAMDLFVHSTWIYLHIDMLLGALKSPII